MERFPGGIRCLVNTPGGRGGRGFLSIWGLQGTLEGLPFLSQVPRTGERRVLCPQTCCMTKDWKRGQGWGGEGSESGEPAEK